MANTSANGSAAKTNEQLINEFKNENFNELQATGGNDEGRNGRLITNVGTSNSNKTLNAGQGGAEVSIDRAIPDAADPKDDPKVLTGKTQFEPNILTQYDNPTYNFRLFISRENAEHDTIASEDIIVIAETGSTGFNIQDVIINTTISPGKVTKNTMTELITFKILEPHGNKLLDQIRNAGVSLGVFDHRNAPIWLQLTFKGYTTGGVDSFNGGIPSASIDGDDLNNVSFLWKIKITDVNIEIDKGGTVYEFKSTPSAHIGHQDSARRLEKEEKIEARTIKEYFEALAKKLNNYDNYSIQSNEDITKRVRRYAFAFPDGKTIGTDVSSTEKNQKEKNAENQPNLVKTAGDMGSWIINNPQDDICNIKRSKNPFAGTIKDSTDSTKKVITFSKGTPIEAIIQEVIGATMEGQSLAINGTKLKSTSDAGEDTSNRPAGTPSIIFMVEPVVDYLSFNKIANLYNLLITYHIRPYKTFKPLINRKQIADYQGKDSKVRLNAILKVANVRKRYDYIFTGLNTEVLDYKIHFQNAWFVPLPIFQGQNKVGTAGSSEINSNKKKAQQVTQPKDLKNEAKDSKQSIVKKKVSELSTVKLSRKLDEFKDNSADDDLTQSEEAERNAINAEINSRKNQDVGFGAARVKTASFGQQPFIRLRNTIRTPVKTKPTGGFTIGAQTARDRIAVRKEANKSANGNGSIFFVEDFENLSVNQRSASDLTDNQKKNILTVSTEPGPTSVPYVGNIETTATKGRSYFSAIMNQMYGSMSDMVELDMTIRGDPYWLGEPDVRKRLSVQTRARDLTNSDVFILVRFGFPKGYGDGGASRNQLAHEGDGLAAVETAENGFNGMYRVIRVENEFSSGKFTQKLLGVIDPVTREQDVIRILTKDSI